MTSPGPGTDERIDTLEIIVAEQQQVIEDLSEMITRQWTAHEKLKREIAQITDQLQELEDNQSAPANQKAPHY